MRTAATPVRVSVRRIVEAAPDTVYDLVSDVTRMGELSPETVQARWLGGADGPAVGVRFAGRNRLGRLTWTTKPVVTAADRGRRFAFRVPGASGTTWTYTFERTDGGTLVTEQACQDRPLPALVRFLQRRAGVTDRQEHLRSAMIVTLDRLALAAAPTP